MIPGIIARQQSASGPVLVVENNFDVAPNVGSLTITKPTGLVAGHRLYAVLFDDDTVAQTSPLWSPPDNSWFRVELSGSGTSDTHVVVFEKLANNDEPASYTFTYSDTTHSLQAYLFYSPDYVRNIGHQLEHIQGSGTAIAVPSVPVHENDTLVVMCFSQDLGGGTITSDNGFLIESEINQTGLQSGLATKVVDNNTGITTFTSTRSDGSVVLPLKLGKAVPLNDPGARRYWSLLINDNAGDTGFSQLLNVELREFLGGTDRTNYVPQGFSLGVGIDDSNAGAGFVGSNAFTNTPSLGISTGDSDNYDNIAYATANLSPTGVYVGWDFGVGRSFNVSEILFYGRYDSDFDRSVTDFTLQYSDDGIAWTETDRFDFAERTTRGATHKVQTSWSTGRGGPELAELNVHIPMGKIDNGVSVRALEPHIVMGKIDTGVSVADMTVYAVIEP